MLDNPLNILVVPDSFKGSASSIQVTEAIISGITQVLPDTICTGIPLADGGEGSLDAIYLGVGGEWRTAFIRDPLGREISARYLLKLPLAYIELAEGSGLQLVDERERDPLLSNTFGTGQLIQAALREGAKEIVLCIGGSATNDGGTGIASALGFEFLDEAGKRFIPNGATLGNIVTIGSVTDNSKPKMTVLCDVDNPFTGRNGATFTFGQQKGADQEQLQQLEKGMVHLQKTIMQQLSVDLSKVTGAGAAGGVGGGMVAFFDATLRSGIDYFIEHLNLDEKIRKANLIITGEGKIDNQTLHGKLISGIVGLADNYDKPVIGVCGALELDANGVEDLGLLAAFSIQQQVVSWPHARDKTQENLTLTMQQIMRTIKRFYNG